MKRSLITLGVVLGGLLAPALPGGVAAARSEAKRAISAESEPEFMAELQEEVFWVEGRLAARAIRTDYEGTLHVEGDWPGAPNGTFHLSDPGESSAAWLFEGRRGQRLLLRASDEGSLVAEIRCPGQPLLREEWRAAGSPEVEVEARAPSPLGALVLAYELRGSPLDLELAVVSDDPAFADLDGLVYLESLGRRPLGRHRTTWSGCDRSAAAGRVPAGSYRLELRERRFLPAPGSEPRERVVASVEVVIGGHKTPQ